jgi:aryl carrier-like protein
MAMYHNVRGGNSSEAGGGDDSLRSFLASVKANPQALRTPETTNMISLEIGRQLFSLLLETEQTPDTEMSLTDLGLDFMVAVELRAWWKLVFGLDISVLEMLAMGTLEALGKRAAEELASKYGA